jgi:competence protein ComEA
MTRSGYRVVLNVSLIALLAASILGASTRVSADPVVVRPGALPQDPAADAFYKVCNDCHEGDRISETKRTRAGWEEMIVQMIDKGAVGSNQDFGLVLQYLLSRHGMVNINQAEADEIALVTGLPAKEAEAIVAFRKANGNFKNYDALIKVPNIDLKKLEAKRASLLF